MLAACEVIAFIATARPADARRFYEGTLGLRLVSDEPSAIVFDANGTLLRVQKVGRVAPAPYTALGWTVPDIKSSVAELTARGVAFERFGSLGQDLDGIWTAPDGTRVAWFKDPDGNILSLTEFRRG